MAGREQPATAERDHAAMHRIERRIGAHAGLKPPDWVLASRVRDRMRGLGIQDLGAYAALLDSPRGERELGALTESLRVGETRFFRHRAHVGAVRRVVVPELAARRAAARRVRAWSAGCATGEESYTLAMLLDEGLPAADGWRIDVLATDLSDEALAIARRGVYPAAAAAAVPPELRGRWIVDGDDAGTVKIAPALAGRVRFERRNLMDPGFPPQIDVIFCRNVLIYFEPAARAQTVKRLAASLAPGGYLFLGYAETLRELAELEALRTSDGVVYRKPAHGAPPGAAPAARAAPAPSPRPAVVTVRITGAHDDERAIAAELKQAIGAATSGVVVDLDGAEFLPDGVAATLRRAAATAQAAGLTFALRATRTGPRRWLTRHGWSAR